MNYAHKMKYRFLALKNLVILTPFSQKVPSHYFYLVVMFYLSSCQQSGPGPPSDILAPHYFVDNKIRNNINTFRNMKKITKTEKVSTSEDAKLFPKDIEHLRLSIPLVYEQILDYIDIPGLNQCRIVSKTWKETADKFLRRKLDLETISTARLVHCRLVSKDWKERAESVLVKRPFSFEVLALPCPLKEWQAQIKTTYENGEAYESSLFKCRPIAFRKFWSKKLPKGFHFFNVIYHDSVLDTTSILEAHERTVAIQKIELDCVNKAESLVSFYKLLTQ